jgi:hypothetical protein
MDETLDRMAEQSADVAMRAAALWLKRSRPDLLESPDLDALVVGLRLELKRSLDDALRDAREAFETHGAAWAAEGFRADLAAAGCRAAAAYAEACDRTRTPEVEWTRIACTNRMMEA